MFNEIISTINNIVEDFGALIRNYNLLRTCKLNNINFLGVFITRNINPLQFSTYRKFTITDKITPASSCHLPEQKKSTKNTS